MNKFRATITFSSQEEKGAIIKAFFADFNPSSKLDIKGNVATMEVFFQDEQPMSIIEVIARCEQVDLHYGNVEKVQKSVSQKEEQSSETSMYSTFKLEQLAGECVSFEQFMVAVEEFMEIKKPEFKTFFESLVLVLSKVDNVTWGKLLAELDKMKVNYKPYDKAKLVKIISKKLDMKSMSFFNKMKEIKKQFGATSTESEKEETAQKVREGSADSKPESKEKSSEKSEVIKQEEKQQPVTSENLRMECMPPICSFEETLKKSSDRNKTIEKRVRYVLNLMNFCDLSGKEMMQIISYTTKAIQMKKYDSEVISKELKMMDNDKMLLLLNFTRLINSFIGEHDSEWQTIKPEIFIEDLQKIIVFEDEIK